ncbi:hypothetical protein GW915_01470 [bacterium]|nr:hypothetical protein [bacterium]
MKISPVNPMTGFGIAQTKPKKPKDKAPQKDKSPSKDQSKDKKPGK